MVFPSKKSTVWKRGSCLSTLITMIVLLISQLGISSASASPTQAKAWQDQWKQVALTSKEADQAGFHPGGEGGQVIRSLRWSEANVNFLMMATDVGGVYRSVNGGKNWQSAMVGWNARGGEGFALDPKNVNRLLGVAGNSLDDPSGHQPNGLYLSTDKAASWKQVLPQVTGYDSNESVSYDPGSYDVNLGYCTIAYYATAHNGLYKTTDGGQSWSQINAGYSGTRVRVHPTKGYVYLTSDQNPNYGTAPGFYKSTDGGKTFTNKFGNYTYGLDVSAADPDAVWVSRYDWVLVSHDAGETFSSTGITGLSPCCTAPFMGVTVSPKDPNYMSVFWNGPNYDYERSYSTDGGKTWASSQYSDKAGVCDPNNRQSKYSLLPCNVRDGVWAYSPVQANVSVSTGGDWITRSTDGGAHYIWDNNGYNGIFVPTFNFNPNNTKNVLIASKDYASYSTIDSGKTWSFQSTGFDWGGYGFGGFALDEKVMWLGNDLRIDSQGPAVLEETSDGGKTWFYPQYNGQNISLADNGSKWGLVSYSDPTSKNSDIGFAGGWRTIDHGKSWLPMSNVDNVYTASPIGKRELYGKSGNDIVISTDHGATWTKVVTVPNGFRELAYDHFHDRIWVSSDSNLMKYENGQLSTVAIPLDQYGNAPVAAVAVDPGNPNVVYVGVDRNIWASNNAILRSTDGGNTWVNMTVNTPLKNEHVAGGPHEVWWIEVNPKTHEAWMSTNCFGIWKIAAPSPTDF